MNSPVSNGGFATASTNARGGARASVLLVTLVLSACGGSSNKSQAPAPLPPPPTAAAIVRVSAATPFAPDCDGTVQSSVLYENAEVEPFVAVNPANPANIIGVWQQDRWADGGAHGLMSGISFDDGKTWLLQPLMVSRCAGGNAGNGADYDRASDPWITISADGTAFAIAISFSGAVFQPGSQGAVLVVRSSDGGQSWSNASVLSVDGPDAFNDKESITADPNDANFIYAVWDRLTTANTGAATIARSADGGRTWEPAHSIYDPGVNNQTINNQVVVLPDGTVVDFFTELDNAFQGSPSAFLAIVRSTDHAQTWSAPVIIAGVGSVGTADPETGQPVRAGASLGQIAAGAAGELVVVWQDARFSSGQRDGVLLSRSDDGGLSWSVPVAINGDPDVQAFVPAVAIQAGGRIGVTYYDFRNNTIDPGTLPTDYWLTQSTDGTNWQESHIAGPFDLGIAPIAMGLFMGDYQGMASDFNMGFVPFFVRTNDNDTTNRTDVYVLPPVAASAAQAPVMKARTLPAETTATMSPEFRTRVEARLREVVRQEMRRRGEQEPP